MHKVDEILAMNKKLSSKKEIKFTLDGCLSDLTKERLSKIAASYEIPQRSKMKKDQLVEAIRIAIMEPSALIEKLNGFDKENLQLLDNLKNKEYIVSTEISLLSYVPLLNYGVIFTYLKNEDVFMVMPKEVKEALNDMSNDEDSQRYFEVVKYIVAFAEAYGVYESEILVETFNLHNEEKLSLEEFNSIFEKYAASSKIVKPYKEHIIESILLYNIESLEQLLENRKKIAEYYKLDKEKIDAYSKEFHCHMTEAHTSLYETFLKLCANKDIADKLFKDICGPLVFSDVNIQYVISELKKRNIQFNTMVEFQNVVAKIQKVNKNTRKWSYKGYTENELALIPNKKLLGRNEPCLCGSGRKYKKCCGR
ncbi:MULTISPECIES: SEC-C metal-binding domain-containing protein [Clostridia]|uniref:SEC-C domain-containing protein n=2 Tax=Clostridia TaxID=186801 RepID=A0A8I0DM56_9CLOT|nr:MULTISPECIES: SEC-C metal-binding domain-containing protein [Clostridia]MBC5640868.1 SEC-C domain-containing protein [Clostridium lentum]MBC5655084.1 SEC-C domain-containing protein [Blautia lenta]